MPTQKDVQMPVPNVIISTSPVRGQRMLILPFLLSRLHIDVGLHGAQPFSATMFPSLPRA